MKQFHFITVSKLFNSKKKKALWVLLLVVAIIGGMYLAYHTEGSSTRVTIDQLSERAKEFVENERKKSGSSWRTTAFEVTDDRRHDLSPKAFETSCFMMHFPFLSRAEHVSDELDKCRVELRMDSPPARVVIAYQLSTQTLDDNGNIIMRKKMSDEYTFEKTSFEYYDESQLYLQKDGLVLFLKKGNILITVGITEMTEPDRLSKDLLKQIVDGFEFKTTE